MHNIETVAYRYAFNQYLRKGTPIELSLKMMQEHLHQKMLGNSTHYIWRTQDDVKVRPEHAANDDKIFAWDNPPDTGHPGEGYGCRCWAEPIGDIRYANQLLITHINDNPGKWTDIDLIERYLSNIGGNITLEKMGHFADVIDHFSNNVITSDGSRGGYQAVEEQIIKRAEEVVEGAIDYDFSGNYEFGNFWDLILINGRYSLGNSTVEGVFDGDVRKEKVDKKEYLVISGVVTYMFTDTFTDPTSRVERLMEEEGITREEAIARLDGSIDKYGFPYDIKGIWRTKFNATVTAK